MFSEIRLAVRRVGATTCPSRMFHEARRFRRRGFGIEAQPDLISE